VTALMYACKHGHTATAELLIAKGADANAKGAVSRGDRGDSG
jgi:ankyrin repeat protein